MDQKKEFLTEENYEKGKKTLGKIIKVVLSVGLSLSLLLILSGIIVIATSNNSDNKEENKTEIKEEIPSTEITKEEEIKQKIADVETKITETKKDLPSLKAQLDVEFRNSGFSEKYYELDQKIDTIEDEINDLEMEKTDYEFDLKQEQSKDAVQNFFDKEILDNEIEPQGILKKGIGAILIFAGLGLIIPTLGISGILFLIYKKREIQIFTTQQTMPVTQETIEKMAPTVGKAGGSVIDGVAPALGNLGKEISKGIKEGIKGEDSKEEK